MKIYSQHLIPVLKLYLAETYSSFEFGFLNQILDLAYSYFFFIVMRSCGMRHETSIEPSTTTMSRCPPLEIAVKALINALPCSSEPGEVYKHPAQIFETILVALLCLSAESSYGRQIVDSWIFQVNSFFCTFSPYLSIVFR